MEIKLNKDEAYRLRDALDLVLDAYENTGLRLGFVSIGVENEFHEGPYNVTKVEPMYSALQAPEAE